MFSIEKTIDEIVQLVKDFFLMTYYLFVKPSRVVGSIQNKSSSFLKPRTYFLISVSFFILLSGLDGVVKSKFPDSIQNSPFSQVTGTIIVAAALIGINNLLLLPLRVSKRIRRDFSSLSYLITGFGFTYTMLISIIFLFHNNTLGYMVLIILVLLVGFIVFAIRVRSAAEKSMVSTFSVKYSLFYVTLTNVVLVFGIFYLMGMATLRRPDVSLVSAYYEQVPVSWSKRKDGGYDLLLKFKVVNNSKYKAVLPAGDSMFVITKNKDNYRFSTFTIVDKFFELDSVKKDKIYFKRAVDNDKELVVKSNDFELITYIAYVSPRTLQSLNHDFSALKRVHGLADVFKKIESVDWIAGFKFFGMEQKYYYAIPFTVTDFKYD